MVATSNKLWLVSGTGDRQLSYASYIPSKMRSHEVASACCRAAARILASNSGWDINLNV